MEKMSPAEVKKLLQKTGLEVSEKESADILEFLRKFATMIVAQYLAEQRDDDDGDLLHDAL